MRSRSAVVDTGLTATAVVDLRATAAELDRMAWYGNPAYRAAVLVER
ncbi:hypothetical protein [Mesorhizobium erdmanii]|nr:hypothetical protein [Mesorhizobium erdmanii]